MNARALLSPCRRYRYGLWRDTGVLACDGTVLFVGLNPSTADETADDPTVRRCLGFARDWGFAQLALANLYAYRATDPRAMMGAEDPVGPENDDHIREMAGHAHMVIAAWGAIAHELPRARAVLDLLAEIATPLCCLGTTAEGGPRHPLYVRADTTPVAMEGA